MAATHTPNLNLAKPDREDYVSVVTAINDNMDILDTAYGNQNTLRVVPFAIDRSAWTASNGGYAATFTSAYVTATSKDIFVGAPGAALSPIIMEKHSGGGGIDCWTEQLPTSTIDGTLYVIDSPDGKIPVIIEDTTIGVENGGTGQSTLAGAKSVLGITNIDEKMATETKSSDTVANIQTWLATLGSTLSNNQFKNIKFVVSTVSGVFAAVTYIGKIMRYASNYYAVDVIGNYDSTEFVQGVYYNGTWKWNNINYHLANDYLVVETYSTSTASSSPYGWSINKAKAGYTPIMHEVYYPYSGSARAGAESAQYSSGSVVLSGYASTSLTIYVKVLWKKNM